MHREETQLATRQEWNNELGPRCIKSVMLGSALDRLEGSLMPSRYKLWRGSSQEVKPYSLPHKTYHSIWALISRRR